MYQLQSQSKSCKYYVTRGLKRNQWRINCFLLLFLIYFRTCTSYNKLFKNKGRNRISRLILISNFTIFFLFFNIRLFVFHYLFPSRNPMIHGGAVSTSSFFMRSFTTSAGVTSTFIINTSTSAKSERLCVLQPRSWLDPWKTYPDLIGRC